MEAIERDAELLAQGRFDRQRARIGVAGVDGREVLARGFEHAADGTRNLRDGHLA